MTQHTTQDSQSNDLDKILDRIVSQEATTEGGYAEYALNLDDVKYGNQIHNKEELKKAIEAYVTTRVKEALLEVKKAGENWEEPNEGTKYELDKKLKALTTTTNGKGE